MRGATHPVSAEYRTHLTVHASGVHIWARDRRVEVPGARAHAVGEVGRVANSVEDHLWALARREELRPSTHEVDNIPVRRAGRCRPREPVAAVVEAAHHAAVVAGEARVRLHAARAVDVVQDVPVPARVDEEEGVLRARATWARARARERRCSASMQRVPRVEHATARAPLRVEITPVARVTIAPVCVPMVTGHVTRKSRVVPRATALWAPDASSAIAPTTHSPRNRPRSECQMTRGWT